MSSRRVTVLLPVYNGEMYLAEAVRSVLAQTFADFELLVIDDGSTDRSGEILRGISDARLRVIRFAENRGLVTALNVGLHQCRTELIARMDADDICAPRRFERQVAFLDAHPEVVLCGTWTRNFGAESRKSRPLTNAKQIRARLFFGWAIDHPSIMFRRSLVERHHLVYDPAYKHAEDLDLFQRVGELGDLANLPEFLLYGRSHAGEISVMYAQEQVEMERLLLARELRKLLPEVTREEEEFHLDLLTRPVDSSSLSRAETWLLRLNRSNCERGRFDPSAFERELCFQSYCLHVQARGGCAALLSFYRRAFSAISQGFLAREHATLAARLTAERVLGKARGYRDRLLRLVQCALETGVVK